MNTFQKQNKKKTENNITDNSSNLTDQTAKL